MLLLLRERPGRCSGMCGRWQRLCAAPVCSVPPLLRLIRQPGLLPACLRIEKVLR